MAGNGLGLPRPVCLLLATWLLRQRCLQTKFQKLCKVKATENIFLVGYTWLRIKATVLYILDKNCTIKLYPNPFYLLKQGLEFPGLNLLCNLRRTFSLRSLDSRVQAWVIKTSLLLIFTTSLSLIYLLIRAQKDFQLTRFNKVYYKNQCHLLLFLFLIWLPKI